MIAILIMATLIITCIIMIICGSKKLKEDYGSDTGVFLCIFGWIILALVIIISIGMIDISKDAIASDQANDYCVSRGYDTYDTYKRQPLGDVAYGIKCNHISNKREILGSDNIIAVVK